VSLAPGRAAAIPDPRARRGRRRPAAGRPSGIPAGANPASGIPAGASPARAIPAAASPAGPAGREASRAGLRGLRGQIRAGVIPAGAAATPTQETREIREIREIRGAREAPAGAGVTRAIRPGAAATREPARRRAGRPPSRT